MKKMMLSLLLAVSVLLPGCSSHDTSSALVIKTSDPTTEAAPTETELLLKWAATTVPADAKLLYSASIGDSQTDFWLIYQQAETGCIRALHHEDKPTSNESSSMLPIQEDWEKQLNEPNVFTSLHSEQSGNPDWILLTSDPAMGQMNKRLYMSSDNGYIWSYIQDVSTIIDGYVTGVTFRDELTGWITAAQHGQQLVPLYRTTDGGKTWAAQPIPIPNDYNYGNVNPPEFQEGDLMNGTLDIEFVKENDQKTFHYVTNDGGETWEVK
ncbi:hypothetical protein DFQ01_10498 [Paenibacillus cellulosilyticus]|uniref:BNR/Asp-box repeat protein n=1 Tax=Paenibacillus cellulosilyticus TaxID=375489 RepID=A0A2V2Z025_9BACL|nr:hypothetical protein [Paenibacillus cellulosilyticus]PWW05538.1 hypothetical protein DFQ01_10498 [Paenibacillus cellulosilyticus]QKS45425.1 hypothetical protein HUB94_14090 [Paenibacillus cellulosilyticus]